MTHDPYQTYATLGTLSGQTNPAAAYNPLTANAGAGYGGIPPQQLQLAAALIAQSAQLAGLSNLYQNPQLGSMSSNPFAPQVHNPLAAAALQHNPFIAAALQYQPYSQNPLQNPGLAQLASAIGQQIGLQPYAQFAHPGFGQAGFGQPFGQPGSPVGQFNTPLAPQSWVGQGQAGQLGQFAGGQGQVHPFVLQSIARALQPQGINPWSTF
jgi:hypothetical protein